MRLAYALISGKKGKVRPPGKPALLLAVHEVMRAWEVLFDVLPSGLDCGSSRSEPESSDLRWRLGAAVLVASMALLVALLLRRQFGG
jgi:hypothetical protein